MWSRRAVVAQTIAFAAFPAAAAKYPPPPKTANIHWPGPGHELHGYMAVPAKAAGRQPAVMVVHDTGGADAFVRNLADRLAQAGFVACAPTAIASLDDAAATVRWLATNRYATGRAAAIGLGWGGELVKRIANAPDAMLAAAVTFGTIDLAQPAIPFLALDPIAQIAASGAEAYEAAWQRTIDFLKEHLA